MRNSSILLLVVISLLACTSPTKKPAQHIDDKIKEVEEETVFYSKTDNSLYNDLFLPSTSGVFRGISFDMSKNEVKEIEAKRLNTAVFKDEQATELIITVNMGSDPINFADVTYTFDEKGLYTIKAETYAAEAVLAKEVFDILIANYTKKYGKAIIAQGGFYEFTVSSDKNNYKIAVKNIDDIDQSFGMYIYYYLDVELKEESI